LAFGSFALSGLKPPLPFPEAHFDVVYATSVLTHLLFETQYLWMAEIWRILKPDGVAILTAHGPSILPISMGYVQAGSAGKVGLTLVDEELFLGIEQDEGSNYTSNVESRGAFERIFSPFRILMHEPRGGLMGIQDTYVLAKKSSGPLRLMPSFGETEMRGTTFTASFELGLNKQRSLTLLASATGLMSPATIQLSVDFPDKSIPSAQSRVLPLPDKVSWTRLESAHVHLAIHDIPAWVGAATLNCVVNAAQAMDGAQLRLRQCALF
jgi:hypothetical protein